MRNERNALHAGRTVSSWVILAGFAASLSAATAPAPDAETLLRAVEKRQATLGSLSASFTQVFRSPDLGQQVVERGRIFVKRPGHMRWDYRQPDRKVFVVSPDGSTIAYVPADMSAVRSRLATDAPHLQLLMGKSDLLQSFAVEGVVLERPVHADSRQLKLTPRRPMEGVAAVYLEVDPRRLSIGRVLVVDTLLNESDLILEKVKEDPGLKDDVFALDLPRGVEVRDAAPPATAPPASSAPAGAGGER